MTPFRNLRLLFSYQCLATLNVLEPSAVGCGVPNFDKIRVALLFGASFAFMAGVGLMFPASRASGY